MHIFFSSIHSREKASQLYKQLLLKSFALHRIDWAIAWKYRSLALSTKYSEWPIFVRLLFPSSGPRAIQLCHPIATWHTWSEKQKKHPIRYSLCCVQLCYCFSIVRKSYSLSGKPFFLFHKQQRRKWWEKKSSRLFFFSFFFLLLWLGYGITSMGAFAMRRNENN